MLHFYSYQTHKSRHTCMWNMKLRHVFSFPVLGPLHDHHGAVRVVGAVVAHAPKNSPLPCSVAMAAHNQHLGVVPVHRLTDHAPRVPFEHLVAHIDHLRRREGARGHRLWHRLVHVLILQDDQPCSSGIIECVINDLGAELLGLVDDPGGGALEVDLHLGQQLGRADAGDADDGGRGGLGGEHDEVVLLRLAGAEEVLQRPLQRVVAVVAVVDAHHHHPLPRSSSFCRRRRRHVPFLNATKIDVPTSFSCWNNGACQSGKRVLVVDDKSGELVAMDGWLFV
uniref:Uncharacterized protein n=1 Tax=Arundo donax TaxID=35708 RepID=A0A0A9H7Z8_ARUDO